MAGDNAPSFDARGDIRAAAVGYGKSIAVGVALEEFDDPSTSENWQGYALGNPDFIVGTGIVWGLDVNDDQVADFNAVMVSDGVNVIAGVTNADGSVILCSGSPSWVAASNAYYVAFTPSCIGSAAHVRAQGFMIYETAIDISSDSTTWTRQVLKPGATTHPASPKSGYWMLGSDGQVYPFGGAVGFSGMVAHAAAMAPRKDGKGYWVVDHTGHVFAYGTAKFFGGAPALGSGEFVSTISATPDGGGYWLFTNKGRVFPFGDAHSFGDMTGTHLNGPIVASVATPSGHGYYMVGSDGGIFCFGDAHFHGSTGNLRLNRPVVGISPTPNGNGYWLVASDGGVFAFNAPFRGSMGGAHLNKAVDGLVAFGNGYLMAASDGGVFDFSNKPFLGSLATTSADGADHRPRRVQHLGLLGDRRRGGVRLRRTRRRDRRCGRLLLGRRSGRRDRGGRNRGRRNGGGRRHRRSRTDVSVAGLLRRSEHEDRLALVDECVEVVGDMHRDACASV